MLSDVELDAAQRDYDAARDRLRRVKMGRPLAVTAADLDALGEVQPSDFAAARALWRAANGGALGDLLDAEPAVEAGDGV